MYRRDNIYIVGRNLCVLASVVLTVGFFYWFGGRGGGSDFGGLYRVVACIFLAHAFVAFAIPAFAFLCVAAPVNPSARRLLLLAGPMALLALLLLLFRLRL